MLIFWAVQIQRPELVILSYFLPHTNLYSPFYFLNFPFLWLWSFPVELSLLWSIKYNEISFTVTFPSLSGYLEKINYICRSTFGAYSLYLHGQRRCTHKFFCKWVNWPREAYVGKWNQCKTTCRIMPNLWMTHIGPFIMGSLEGNWILHLMFFGS